MAYTDSADQAAYAKRHYLANSADYIARAKAHKQACRARNRAWLVEQKARPCLDCGIQYPPYVMEYDHTGDDKVASVSALANQGVPLSRLQAEIDKCGLVCANCHRERTHQRAAGRSSDAGS